jgi:hypothetical protein
MSTEQKTEESTDKGTLDESQIKSDDEILTDAPAPLEDAGPLFSEEGVEGSGDEEEAAPEKAEGEKEKPGSEEEAAAAQPEGEKEPTAKEKAEEEPKKEAEPEKKEEEGKPPAGYVEIGALKEARGQMKEQREEHSREIQTLRQEMASLKKAQEEEEQPDTSQWKDFKVLSDKDFQDLADTNPIDAI